MEVQTASTQYGRSDHNWRERTEFRSQLARATRGLDVRGWLPARGRKLRPIAGARAAARLARSAASAAVAACKLARRLILKRRWSADVDDARSMPQDALQARSVPSLAPVLGVRCTAHISARTWLKL